MTYILLVIFSNICDKMECAATTTSRVDLQMPSWSYTSDFSFFLCDCKEEVYYIKTLL